MYARGIQGDTKPFSQETRKQKTLAYQAMSLSYRPLEVFHLLLFKSKWQIELSSTIGLWLIRCCIIGPPIFEVWDVTTGVNGIRIHYRFKKRPPDVTEIKWIKDEVPILKRNKKYEGGKLNDSYFTITSPTIEDRGHYSCVVQNVVGSVQKDVQFGTVTFTLC